MADFSLTTLFVVPSGVDIASAVVLTQELNGNICEVGLVQLGVKLQTILCSSSASRYLYDIVRL